MVRITALMDNQASEHKALIAEHGLSYYLEYDGFRLLFDCGSGPHFLDNAHRLGIDLHELDAVALSHSHYDHAAGYRDLIEQGFGSSVLYTGPHFWETKYAFDGVRYTDLSAGFTQDFLSQHHIRHQCVTGVQEIHPGVFLVSDFPRIHDFETIPSRFLRRTQSGFIPDDFSDEQCVVLKVPGGIAVLVGCSHPGILNMLSHIRDCFRQPIVAVYGGTHLVEADEHRIAVTVQALQDMGVQILGLSHCSGHCAETYVHENTDLQGCHLSVGDTIFYD